MTLSGLGWGRRSFVPRTCSGRPIAFNQAHLPKPTPLPQQSGLVRSMSAPVRGIGCLSGCPTRHPLTASSPRGPPVFLKFVTPSEPLARQGGYCVTAMPTLNNTPLDRIYRRDVLRVLTPLWTTRPVRRQRIRTVFRWALAHGFMESNPAGEAIDGALPPMPKVRAHFRALPYQEGRIGTRNCGSVRILKPR